MRDHLGLLVIALHGVDCWVLYSPTVKLSSQPGYEMGTDGRVWTSPNTFNLDSVSLRWSLPESKAGEPYKTDGLNGGITFAFHPDFCPRLLPLFPESADHLKRSSVLSDQFLSCGDLQDTVKRAMDTWAINHPRIYFRDVTEQCRDSTSYDRCPAAELLIAPDKPDGESITKAGDLAAFVTHPVFALDLKPTTTAGFEISGLGVPYAKMTMRAPLDDNEFCWYLDTTFCYGFHRWKDAITALRAIFLILFMIALVVLIAVFVCGIRTVFFRRAPSRKGNQGRVLACGSERLTNLLEYLSDMPTITLLIAVFLVIFCPVFYYRIFLPCWDCYDFEATVAHEVGHVLGFHHPDVEWALNLKANGDGVMNSSTCRGSLNHVHLDPSRQIEDSIMFSITKRRDRTCLTADDLEGLNFLYPSCEGAMQPSVATGEPLCIKGKRSGGWLRLIYVVFMPWFIVSCVAIIAQIGVRWHIKRRLRAIESRMESFDAVSMTGTGAGNMQQLSAA